MKNRMRIILLLITVVVLLGGCGRNNKTTPTPSAGTVSFHPCTGSVTIGQYKGLTLPSSKVEITEADVDEQIKQFLAVRPNYVKDEDKDIGKAIEKGDIVNIDFVGRKDGEPFEGGSSEGYDLEIGSGAFIEGFEDGLIGVKPGETLTIDVTFPESYPRNPSLAGAAVQFEVTVNYYSKKTDEITDEYVKKNSRSYQTVKEFREFVRANLLENAQAEADEQAGFDLLDVIVLSSVFTEIAEADIEYYYQRLITPYQDYAKQYGMELGDFLKLYTDYSSVEEFYARSRELAISSVKQFMVLQKIAEAENITVTPEEYGEYVAGIRDEGGYADNTAVETLFGKDFLTYNKQMDKALEFVKANAVRQ